MTTSAPFPSSAIAAALLAMAAITLSVAQLSAQSPGKSTYAHGTTAGQANATYVGSSACSRCHLVIANQFARTSMGRSLTPVTPEFLRNVPTPAHYFDANSGHYFEVREESGKLYQSESEIDSQGKEVFRNAHPIDWIIGTGENGFGALLSRDGYLFQAPLSYYTRAAKWDLSPGYEHLNQSFNRIILPGCIYCHSGRPQPVPNFTGKYEKPAFSQIAVGCENCHGPGSAHVQAMREGDEADAADLNKAPDPTIVNPARLTGQLSDDICISCHQTGDARVLQPGKTYQDFRPAQALDNTLSVFEIPPTRQAPPQDDHVEHYYSMSLSKCFRASASQPPSKQLRCITCHDPHVEPTRAEAPAYYNAKCLTCHTTQSCTEKPEIRHRTLPGDSISDNCIGCHMPKREIRVISHSMATNHRVPARPDEPFPDEAFSQATAAMPDLIHLNPAGQRLDAARVPTPPALNRLLAYGDLMRIKPAYAASWRRVLSEIENTPASPVFDSAPVQAALGHRDLEDHKFQQARSHLQQSLRLNPAQPDVYVDLSEVADQTGQVEEAISYARKAVELDPFSAPMQKALIFHLIGGKHYEEAQVAMERYLKTFPEDDFMRKMLTLAKTP